MKRELAILFIALFLINNISALRISPAIIKENFKPGMELNIPFIVDNTLNRTLEIYSTGDLADYITFNKDNLTSSGTFLAMINLPDTIEPPGKKVTYIGIREIVPDSEIKGGVATAVAIQSVFVLQVPYPGKYLESTLTAHDVNIKEPITFSLKVISRGTQAVVMKPRIEIYSRQDELFETLEFNEREIQSGQIVDLEKIWDTMDYGAGSYYALSEIDYDVRTAESRADFRIGDLVINIVNHSDSIIIGGLKSFWIEIESGWNNKIDGAYADVSIYNKTGEIIKFRTSPTDLEPWQKNIISGYFDTNLFEPGKYDANATVTYYGKEQGRSISKILQVKLIKEDEANYLIIAAVSIGIIILLILLFFLFIRLKKHGSKK